MRFQVSRLSKLLITTVEGADTGRVSGMDSHMCAQTIYFSKKIIRFIWTPYQFSLNLFIQLRYFSSLFEICLNFYRGLNFMVEIKVGKLRALLPLLVNKTLIDHSYTYLCIVYGCLCTTMAAFVLLNSCKRDPQTLKYLLSNISQKKFADFWFKW